MARLGRGRPHRPYAPQQFYGFDPNAAVFPAAITRSASFAQFGGATQDAAVTGILEYADGEGTAAATITSGNSVFEVFNGSGTRTYETTPTPVSGTTCMAFDSTGAGVQSTVKSNNKLPGTSNGGNVLRRVFMRSYVRASATPTGATRFMVVEESATNGGTDIGSMRINATGAFAILDNTTSRGASTRTVSTTEWTRCELMLDQDSNTITGRLWWGADLHNASTSATNYETWTGSLTSNDDMEVWGIGNYAANVASTLYIDEVAIGGGDWIGPVDATQSATATPSAITRTASTPSPTSVSGSASVSPSAITRTSSVGSITFTSAVSVSTGQLTLVANTPAGSYSGAANTAPGAITRVASTPTPTVTTSTNVNVTPSAITRTGTTYTPTVSGSASYTTSAITRAATVGSITFSSAVSVSPSAITRTATTNSITFNAAVGVTPSAITRTASIPAPSNIFGNASRTQGALTRTATVYVPDVRFGYTLLITEGCDDTDGTTVSTSNSVFDEAVGSAGSTYRSTPTPVVGSTCMDINGTTLTKVWWESSTLPGSNNGGTAYTRLYSRFYVRASNATPAAGPVALHRFSDATHTNHLGGVQINTAGQFAALDDVTSRGTSTRTISTSEWTRVELMSDQDNNVVTLRLWWGADLHNPATVGVTNYETVTGAMNSNEAMEQWSISNTTSGGNQNTIIYFDEIAVATGGWIGPVDVGGATATPSAITRTASVGSPTVSGSASFTESALTRTASTPTPTVFSPVAVTPSAIPRTATTYSPTVAGSALYSQGALTRTATVNAITFTSAVSVSPSAITRTASVPARTVFSSVSIAPSAITRIATVPSSTESGSALVTPSALTRTATTYTPTVTTGANASVSPSAITRTASVGSPSFASAVSITTSAITRTATVPLLDGTSGWVTGLLAREPCEGTNGASITSSNTIFELQNGSGTSTFTNSITPAVGGGSTVIDVNATTNQRVLKDTSSIPGSTNGGPVLRRMFARFYSQLSGSPAAQTRFFGFETDVESAGVDVAFLRVNASRLINIMDGLTATGVTATHALSTTEWTRVEMMMDQQNNQIKVRLWWGADLHNPSTGATNFEELTATMNDNGDAEVIGIGIHANSIGIHHYLDDIAIGGGDWIGPPVIHATVTPGALTRTGSVPSPTPSGYVSVTTSAITRIASVGSITFTSGVSRSQGALTRTASVGSISFASSASVSPGALTRTASAPTPTVTTAGNASVSPAAITRTAVVPTPTVTTSTNASVSPSAITRTASVGAATFTTKPDVPTNVRFATTYTPTFYATAVAVPGALTRTASVPSGTPAGSALAAPGAISRTRSVPTPTFSSNVSVGPGAVSRTASVPSGTQAGAARATPTVITIAANIPTAIVQISVAVQAAVIHAAASTASGNSSFVSPNGITIVALIPSAGASSSRTATPGAITATATIAATQVTAGVQLQTTIILRQATVWPPSRINQADGLDEIIIGKIEQTWELGLPRLGWRTERAQVSEYEFGIVEREAD